MWFKHLLGRRAMICVAPNPFLCCWSPRTVCVSVSNPGCCLHKVAPPHVLASFFTSFSSGRTVSTVSIESGTEAFGIDEVRVPSSFAARECMAVTRVFHLTAACVSHLRGHPRLHPKSSRVPCPLRLLWCNGTLSPLVLHCSSHCSAANSMYIDSFVMNTR